METGHFGGKCLGLAGGPESTPSRSLVSAAGGRGGRRTLGQSNQEYKETLEPNV